MEPFLNITPIYMEKNIILKKAKEFLSEIPKNCLIFVTARSKEYKDMTLKSLDLLDIYDGIIFNISSTKL